MGKKIKTKKREKINKKKQKRGENCSAFHYGLAQ